MGKEAIEGGVSKVERAQHYLAGINREALLGLAVDEEGRLDRVVVENILSKEASNALREVYYGDNETWRRLIDSFADRCLLSLQYLLTQKGNETTVVDMKQLSVESSYEEKAGQQRWRMERRLEKDIDGADTAYRLGKKLSIIRAASLAYLQEGFGEDMDLKVWLRQVALLAEASMFKEVDGLIPEAIQLALTPENKKRVETSGPSKNPEAVMRQELMRQRENEVFWQEQEKIWRVRYQDRGKNTFRAFQMARDQVQAMRTMAEQEWEQSRARADQVRQAIDAVIDPADVLLSVLRTDLENLFTVTKV